MPYKSANTGIDAKEIYSNFIKKDVIENIDVHRDSEEKRAMSSLR